jgi:solute carrier family 35 protein F5
LALFGDIVFKNFVPQVQYAMGALLVVIGFVFVNMAALKERKEDTSDDDERPLLPPHPTRQLIPDSPISTAYQTIQ